MRPREIKVVQIGNSKGIRLPSDTLRRYRIGASLVMEQRSDGILLRPARAAEKLSWDDTAIEMAATAEDWSDWDDVIGDGLGGIPWESDGVRRVAEPRPTYPVGRKKRKP